jgi:Fic-DOC domain mobile mystery protein B
MLLDPTAEANTPLSADELAELIPNLATKDELNEFERANIYQARIWAMSGRQLKKCDPFSEAYLRELHTKMFDHTWKWAGKYRTTEKNLGVPPHLILERIGVLLGDARFWTENQTYSVDEIAVRFHHGLVQIHPFPNGNGRHARLIADVIVAQKGRATFTWGDKELVQIGPVRESYLNALREADDGNIQPLLAFARS